MIDTNVAVHLRDKSAEVVERVAALREIPVISIITLVELEGGVNREPNRAVVRRKRLNAFLTGMTVLEFEQAMAFEYGQIVERCGFSRPRILDRLIAATAIVHDLTLVTVNAADFRDIPGLKLEAWPAPPAQ